MISEISNNTTLYNDACPYSLEVLNDLRTSKRTPAIIYLSISMIFGILGNLLVIFVYFGTLRTKKKPHWTFVRAMAITDFLVCVIVIPFEIYQQINQLTFYSNTVCKLFRAISVYSTVVSSLFIMSMSAHRVRLVCHPLKQQLTPRQTSFCICIVAIISIIFAWPEAVLSGLSVENLGCNLTGYDCSFSDRFTDTVFPTAYSAVLQSLFIVCIIALVVMYLMIGHRVFRHSGSSAKNMTKIAFVISFCFVLSYLPYVSIKLNAAIKRGNFIVYDETEAVFPILGRMFIINNIVNPYVYWCLNSSFREGSMKFIVQLKCKVVSVMQYVCNRVNEI